MYISMKTFQVTLVRKSKLESNHILKDEQNHSIIIVQHFFNTRKV